MGEATNREWHEQPRQDRRRLPCALAALAVAGDVASYASAEPYKKKRLRAPYAGKHYSRVYHRDKDDSFAGN